MTAILSEGFFRVNRLANQGGHRDGRAEREFLMKGLPRSKAAALLAASAFTLATVACGQSTETETAASQPAAAEQQSAAPSESAQSDAESTPNLPKGKSSEQGEDAATKQESPLERFAEDMNDRKSSIPEYFISQYSGISFTPEPPSTIHLKLSYKKQQNVDEAQKKIEIETKRFADSFLNSGFISMKERGITDPEFKITYYNADGNEIWNKTFTHN